MRRSRLIFLLLTLFMVATPVAHATLPANLFDTWHRIETNGIDVPEGYWVYGTIRNNDFYNKREIIIEVTLLDSQGGPIDTVTTMVRPTILKTGDTASFLAKSTTQEEVAEIKAKVKSSVDTKNENFQYLEVSQVIKQGNAVSGKLSNTHDHIYVFEGEVIVTFYDGGGKVVDIQSFGVNNNGQFDPQTSHDFYLESSRTMESYSILTQSNRATRIPYMIFDVERPYANGTFTTPIGETIFLVLKDDPWRGALELDVKITDPNGVATDVKFLMAETLDFRYEITPDTAGVWNVSGSRGSYLVNNSVVLVEDLVYNYRFFVFDPQDEVDTSSSESETPIQSNNTISEKVDELSSSAKEIVDRLPEEVKKGIPGFPIASVLVALAVVWVIPRFKAHQI